MLIILKKPKTMLQEKKRLSRKMTAFQIVSLPQSPCKVVPQHCLTPSFLVQQIYLKKWLKIEERKREKSSLS